jgi:hypothetical protein
MRFILILLKIIFARDRSLPGEEQNQDISRLQESFVQNKFQKIVAVFTGSIDFHS